jgi:hypothetical protein
MNGIVLITHMPVRRIVALATVALASLLATSVLAANGPGPTKYRFTGWMSPSAVPGGWPSHLLVEGDAGTLRFADRLNLTRKPVAYRVCVFRLGSSRGPCRRSAAPISARPSVLPLFVSCCGEFVAKWYVGGRVVATWPFQFVREHP